jgi:RNA polymerase sigma-54 factor
MPIMKPTLQLKTSQHLTLTPQLQESIRLLQLSTVDLNQEIERLVQENPLLELDDSISSSVEYMGALEAGVEPLSVDLIEVPEEGVKLLSEDSPDAKKAAGEADWLEDESASRGMRDDDDERDYPQHAAEPPSLREHLNSQLSLSQIPERDRKSSAY